MFLSYYIHEDGTKGQSENMMHLATARVRKKKGIETCFRLLVCVAAVGVFMCFWKYIQYVLNVGTDCAAIH